MNLPKKFFIFKIFSLQFTTSWSFLFLVSGKFLQLLNSLSSIEFLFIWWEKYFLRTSFVFWMLSRRTTTTTKATNAFILDIKYLIWRSQLFIVFYTVSVSFEFLYFILFWSLSRITNLFLNLWSSFLFALMHETLRCCLGILCMQVICGPVVFIIVLAAGDLPVRGGYSKLCSCKCGSQHSPSRFEVDREFHCSIGQFSLHPTLLTTASHITLVMPFCFRVDSVCF